MKLVYIYPTNQDGKMLVKEIANTIALANTNDQKANIGNDISSPYMLYKVIDATIPDKISL